MKYEVMVGFDTDKKRFEAGDILDEKDIPSKSKKWMVEQGIIEKKTEADLKKEAEKKMEELNMVRARNEKGHYIADDPNTEENEAWVEKEEEEMAFVHGKDSKVYVTTIDLSAYFNSAEFQTTADVSETTAFGKSAKTYKAGLREGSATLSGFWDGGTDASDEELQVALGSSTNKVVALGIDGVDTGDKVKFFDGFATNYGISSQVGYMVAVSADYVAYDGM